MNNLGKFLEKPRKKKGLKINDINDLIMKKPNEQTLKLILDSILNSKIQQDVEIFGKPNVIVNI